jgi:hypothetical protein
MDQSPECALIFAKRSRVFKTRTGLLAVNADLPIFGLWHQLVAAPGAKRTAAWLDGIEAITADWQGGDIGEWGVTDTAIGGEKRRKEALRDKTKDSGELSLDVARATGTG